VSFQQGLSGLNAASRNLEVIGNNVSNSNTIGFKESTAQFADVFASSINGAGNSLIGTGTQVSGIAQSFAQGNISVSENPLDLAINGKGFFKVRNGQGDEIYTRNGQFSLNGQGYLVNSSGSKVLGYTFDDKTKTVIDKVIPIQLPQRPIPPKGTGTGILELNLDARKKAPTAAFDVTDLTSYNDTTSMAIYDQLGGSHTVSYYFRRDPDVSAGVMANSWKVYATVDGAAVGNGPFGTLQFDNNGLASNGSSTILTLPVAGMQAGSSSFVDNIELDMTSSTQYGSAFQVNNLDQNGYASGDLTGVLIAPDGRVTARYTNGQSQDLAKVGLFGFRNPEALRPVGSNGWVLTEAAGAEYTPANDGSGFGVIQSGALEEANMDLTAQLVDMITAQRVYQANAQTIKTQDSILQTLVNLR
jgi:flagellar hook protein FlgE